MENETSDKPKFKFGLKRSSLSERDKLCYFQYEHVDMPIQFSLSEIHNIHIFDQGHLNACSSNAISNQIILSTNREDLLNIIPSRLYQYFNSRLVDKIENNLPSIEDDGASLKAAYEALVKYRIVDENKYPYIEDKVNKFPSPDIYRQAYKQKSIIHSYRRIYPQLYSMKYILYVLKKPICFGMSVFENFVTLNKNNYMLSKPEGQFLGLHAVLIHSYNDETKAFGIINSHGRNFGNDGIFEMSYDYVLNPELSFEFWIINEI